MRPSKRGSARLAWLTVLALAASIIAVHIEGASEATLARRAQPQPPSSAASLSQAPANATVKGHNRKRKPTTTSTTTTAPSSHVARQSPPDPGAQPATDLLALAQYQAQLMLSYNNTPPTFVTPIRDLFVDVARPHQPGARLATIKASDLNNDTLEYSLQPACLHDASPYFTINSSSGELQFADKPLPALVEPSPGGGGEAVNLSHPLREQDDGEDDEAAVGGGASGGGGVSAPASPDYGDQLYFLNVAVHDGKYTTVLECQVHRINSSALAQAGTLAAAAAAEVGDDEAEGGARGRGELLDSTFRRKSNEFYGNLFGKPNASDSSSSALVYPNFVNPSLVRPDQMVAPAPAASLDPPEGASEVGAGEQPPHNSIATNPLPRANQQHHQHLHHNNHNHHQPHQHQHHQHLQPMSSTSSQHQSQRPTALLPYDHTSAPPLGLQHHGTGDETQPMIISSLVIACSCLMIVLVVLLFVVPLSVKGLRRRVKQVELQHERLSSQDSASQHRPSSTVCSSSGASSMLSSLMMAANHKLNGANNLHDIHNNNNNNHHHLHHHHLHPPPAHHLSQFTLNSTTGSSVCRQSSFDSTATTSARHHETLQHQLQPSAGRMQQQQQPPLQLRPPPPPLLSRVNNGSINNPVYLQQQQQQLLQHNHIFVGGRHAGADDLMGAPNSQPPPHLQLLKPQPAASEILQHHNAVHKSSENVYYPLDDDFYSTINTETTLLEGGPYETTTRSNNVVVENFVPAEPEMNPMSGGAGTEFGLTSGPSDLIEHQTPLPPLPPPSNGGDLVLDEGSSVRTLAKFLSLPARRLVQQQANGHQQSQAANREGGDQPNETDLFVGRRQLNVQSKTIARSTQVVRENNNKARPDKWEVERFRVRFLDILDEGQFGLVWRCKLRPPASGATDWTNDEQTIAVKTLKNSAQNDRKGRDELLAEIEIMKMVCDHPNVVRILHCCTSDAFNGHPLDDKPILLLMEYVELGKLQSFLQKSRKNHCYATNRYNNVHDSSDHLTSRDLIKFIYHVAQGMEYISSMAIVHRDVACRNILLNSNRICKVGDFGMARLTQSPEGVYERHSRNTKVPVRWMAPEVLLNNRFTTKSDVYSFGILMWEIVTLGSTPYAHLKTEQVIDEVARSGQRPDKPEHCHSQLYNIMSKCWHSDPSMRPSFKDLIEHLDELMLSANDYIELDQYPDHNYYNIANTAAPHELL